MANLVFERLYTGIRLRVLHQLSLSCLQHELRLRQQIFTLSPFGTHSRKLRSQLVASVPTDMDTPKIANANK